MHLNFKYVYFFQHKASLHTCSKPIALFSSDFIKVWPFIDVKTHKLLSTVCFMIESEGVWVYSWFDATNWFASNRVCKHACNICPFWGGIKQVMTHSIPLNFHEVHCFSRKKLSDAYNVKVKITLSMAVLVSWTIIRALLVTRALLLIMSGLGELGEIAKGLVAAASGALICWRPILPT